MGATTTECPRCGAPRAPGAAWRALCPACLLATALSLDDDPCPYQVLTPIAESPHAVTYLAQALTGARGYVALKIYGTRSDTDAILARYQRWAPVLETFRHHAFCRLLNVNLTAQGQLYTATEYVHGSPMTAIDGRPSIDAGTRLELAHQLAGAIEAAHEAGVAHLALAPSKVKVSTANGVRTTILGLGSSLIVEGADARPDLDVAALVLLARGLGVQLPHHHYDSAAALRAAMPLRSSAAERLG